MSTVSLVMILYTVSPQKKTGPRNLQQIFKIVSLLESL